MFRKILIWCLPFSFAAITAFAQSNDMSKNIKEMQKQATKLDSEAAQNQDTVFNSLSKELNVPVATLKAQQTSTNFGPGQLFIANSLASASGKTFEQVAGEFKSAKGWGDIAKENNLNLGNVVRNLKRANKEAEQERMDQARANSHGSNAGGSTQSNNSSAHSSQTGITGHRSGQSGSRGRH